MNIHTAIEEANSKLKKKKIKSASLDTEILMSSVIKKDRKYIILNSNQILSNKDVNDFHH